MDSLTELASGSSVSTRTALATTSVLLPAAEVDPPDDPPELLALEHPAAATAMAIRPRLSVLALGMAHPLRRQLAWRFSCHGFVEHSLVEHSLVEHSLVEHGLVEHSVDCRQRGLTVGRYRTEVNRPLLPACPALRLRSG